MVCSLANASFLAMFLITLASETFSIIDGNCISCQNICKIEVSLAEVSKKFTNKLRIFSPFHKFLRWNYY